MDSAKQDIGTQLRSVELRSENGTALRACIVTVTAKGRRHMATGEQNQDAVLSLVREQAPSSALLAAADGLGSCRFSDIGSRLAVRTIADRRDLLREVLLNRMTFEEASRQIGDAWIRGLSDSLGPVPVEEYDSTLLFAFWENDELIVAQLGDGLIQWRIDGQDAEELFGRGGDFANRTSSLVTGRPWAFRRIRLGCFRQHSVLLATDGIADDLKPEHRSRLTELLAREVRLNGPERAAAVIEEWVRDWPTYGHSDDRTLAFLTVWHEGVELDEG